MKHRVERSDGSIEYDWTFMGLTLDWGGILRVRLTKDGMLKEPSLKRWCGWQVMEDLKNHTQHRLDEQVIDAVRLHLMSVFDDVSEVFSHDNSTDKEVTP